MFAMRPFSMMMSMGPSGGMARFPFSEPRPEITVALRRTSLPTLSPRVVPMGMGSGMAISISGWAPLTAARATTRKAVRRVSLMARIVTPGLFPVHNPRVTFRDVAKDVKRWRAEGEEVALATVVRTWGSGPRGPGAKMALTRDARIAGSVSGGGVEAAGGGEGRGGLGAGRGRLVAVGGA